MTFPFEVTANVSHRYDETLGLQLLALEKWHFCHVFQKRQGQTIFFFLVFYLQQGQFSRSCNDPVPWHVSGCTESLCLVSQLALPLPRTGISVPLPCICS